MNRQFLHANLKSSMPIRNFDGDTFVAFTDISGFTKMMNNRSRAEAALHHFFETGYNLLDEDVRGATSTVEGVFISDCGILFVRPNRDTLVTALERLLTKIRQLNKELLPHHVMLTTSVAYGNFKFQDRVVFSGIIKNLLCGRAYLNAVIDSESSKSELECGLCRIVCNGLPDDVLPTLNKKSGSVFSMIRPVKSKHFYYYWMLDNQNDIDRFESDYRKTEELKFEGIRKILSGEKLQPL
jgi:hypothetical protein